MIRNLNQMTFREFGTILSERRQAARTMEKGNTIQLSRGEAPVFHTLADTWLSCGTGMAVLAVCGQGEDFQDFYLDKSVCIKAGVRFSLIPFNEDASVQISTAIPPEQVGTRTRDSLRIDHKIRVSGLYTFFYQEKEQGFLFPGESHAITELTYVDQGSLHSVADGQDLLLNQGDIVIYGPGQWHMQYADVDMSPSFITITFDLAGEYPAELINRKFTIPQSAVSTLQRMLRELDRMDDFSADMVICMLQVLLLELLREQANPVGTKLRATNAVNSENEIIRRAQQYISEHVREKLTVPLVARHVDVSPSYLTALFRKNLQISPGEYVRRIKLQESKQMIREDNMNFTEIAAALQYSTVHHFSRQFKDKFGITPTEYAKSVR